MDEGLSLFLAGRSVHYSLEYLRTLDVHPPLFAIVLHLLVAAHWPDSLLRLLAAGCGVVSVILLYWIVRFWVDDPSALIAAAMAAFMPSLIYYDSMVRMYAPFDAIALAQILLVSMLLRKNDWGTGARRALWVAWAVTVAIGSYLLYLSWIVAAAQLIYAAAARRDALMRALAGLGAAFAAWLPQLPTFLAQFPAGGLAFPWARAHPLLAMATMPAQATVATQLAGRFAELAAFVVLAWLGVLLYAALRYTPATIIPWLGLPAGLTLLLSVLTRKALYVDRYYLLLAYALCAWTAVGITGSARRWPRLVAVGAGAVFLVLGALGIQRAFYPAYYTADWPAVARLLKEQAKPNDTYVFEQGSPAYVLGHAGALMHHTAIVIFRRRDVPVVLHSLAGRHRLWVVVFQQVVDPSNELLRYIERHWRLAGD